MKVHHMKVHTHGAPSKALHNLDPGTHAKNANQELSILTPQWVLAGRRGAVSIDHITARVRIAAVPAREERAAIQLPHNRFVGLESVLDPQLVAGESGLVKTTYGGKRSIQQNLPSAPQLLSAGNDSPVLCIRFPS